MCYFTMTMITRLRIAETRLEHAGNFTCSPPHTTADSIRLSVSTGDGPSLMDCVDVEAPCKLLMIRSGSRGWSWGIWGGEMMAITNTMMLFAMMTVMMVAVERWWWRCQVMREVNRCPRQLPPTKALPLSHESIQAHDHQDHHHGRQCQSKCSLIIISEEV